MSRLGAIVRYLMLAACLVPFTNTRQAAGALAPFVPPVAGTATEAPAGEEDDERETDAKEHAAPAKHRPPTRELTDLLPPCGNAHLHHPFRVRTAPPVAADPFRNGLGTPYRC